MLKSDNRHAFIPTGATSPLSGRKAVMYEATMPDGTVLRKRSYFIQTETAWAGCYLLDEGFWRISGITDAPKDWVGQTFVVARRVE